jgi:hypothetical protein
VSGVQNECEILNRILVENAASGRHVLASIPRSNDDGGTDAEYAVLRREHDDEPDDASRDGPGQCHGRCRNAGRIASIAIGLLTR